MSQNRSSFVSRISRAFLGENVVLPRRNLYGGLVLFACGVAVAGIGFALAYGGAYFLNQHARASGVVTHYQTSAGDQPTYRPVFTFEPEPGLSPVTVTANISTSWQPYALGESVTVQFDPERPRQASIVGGNRTFALLLGGMGLLTMSFGASLVLRWWAKHLRYRALIRDGRRVEGTVTEVFSDMTVAVNKDYPLRARVSYAAAPGAQLTTFTSQLFWPNDADLGTELGAKVDVYLERGGEGRMVDLRRGAKDS